MLGALGKVRGWIPWNIFVGRYLVWLLLTAGPSSKEAEVAQSLPSKILVISEEYFRALVTAAVGPQAVQGYPIPGPGFGLCSVELHKVPISLFLQPAQALLNKCVFITSVVFARGANTSRGFTGLPIHTHILQGGKDGAGSLLSPHGLWKVAFCLWMTLDINVFRCNTHYHISIHPLRNEKLWTTNPPLHYSGHEGRWRW